MFGHHILAGNKLLKELVELSSRALFNATSYAPYETINKRVGHLIHYIFWLLKVFWVFFWRLEFIQIAIHIFDSMIDYISSITWAWELTILASEFDTCIC